MVLNWEPTGVRIGDEERRASTHLGSRVRADDLLDVAGVVCNTCQYNSYLVGDDMALTEVEVTERVYNQGSSATVQKDQVSATHLHRPGTS